MKLKGRTTTKTSGASAIALAISLIHSGQYVDGGIVFAIGVGLLALYEWFNVKDLSFDEKELEQAAEDISDSAESLFAKAREEGYKEGRIKGAEDNETTDRGYN